MRFSVLSSGSKANSTFIEAGGKRLLIDCGLSAKQTEIRLRKIGIEPESLDGILVTHEHGDHIRGISVMSRRYKLPVYVNEATAEFIDNVYGTESFITGRRFFIGDVSIAPFSLVHDAVDPVGFSVRSEGLRFVQATDLGRVTPLVRDALFCANAMVVESNYDEELLLTCGYPWELKQRISSSHGHLSNDDAATLLSEVMHGELLHVVLGHLSENSNHPDFALRATQNKIAVSALSSFVCGSPYEPTPLVEVDDENAQTAITA